MKEDKITCDLCEPILKEVKFIEDFGK